MSDDWEEIVCNGCLLKAKSDFLSKIDSWIHLDCHESVEWCWSSLQVQ